MNTSTPSKVPAIFVLIAELQDAILGQNVLNVAMNSTIIFPALKVVLGAASRMKVMRGEKEDRVKIAIVYDSAFGHTAQQARAVARGAESVDGAMVSLIAVAEGGRDWAELEAADAIIFGSPTYNGLVSARFKQFMEDTTQVAWRGQKWRNKISAGFTNSGAMHGDKLNSLVSMALFAAQHGMIWVGLDLFPGRTAGERNRVGGWLGAMAQSNDESPELSPIASDLETAAYLGERVASVTAQMLRGRA